MDYSSKMGLEPLYHETNRNISDTHAALAQLSNYSNCRGEWNAHGSAQQNQNVQARKVESSIANINR